MTKRHFLAVPGQAQILTFVRSFDLTERGRPIPVSENNRIRSYFVRKGIQKGLLRTVLEYLQRFLDAGADRPAPSGILMPEKILAIDDMIVRSTGP